MRKGITMKITSQTMQLVNSTARGKKKVIRGFYNELMQQEVFDDGSRFTIVVVKISMKIN